MAYPTVVSLTPSTFGSDATSHAVAMPASGVLAGMGLVCVFTNDGNATVTTPNGWTAKSSDAATTTLRLSVYVKVADGTEGGTTVDFVTSATEQAAAQVYLLSTWFGALTGFEVGTAASDAGGASTQPDPPSLTPSWTGDTMFLAIWGHSNSTVTDTYSSNYTNGAEADSGDTTAAAQVASCRRFIQAAAENPGAGSFSGGAAWVAQTLAVRGGASAGGGGGGQGGGGRGKGGGGTGGGGTGGNPGQPPKKPDARIFGSSRKRRDLMHGF